MSSVIKGNIKEHIDHIKEKKSYYFGKNEHIYNFYLAQEVLLMDLIAKNMLREGE